MSSLGDIAPPFIAMAHRIVWATVATVDTAGRPRSRILHPIWEFDDDELVGWIGTSATPLKTAHLDATPFVSVNYWDPQHDVATAECRATFHHDDETCTRIWNLLKHAPAPVGYDPAIIPVWTEPTASTFSALRLDPWRLRVFPGSLLLEGTGDVLDWHAAGI
jgi:hypothetical protein